MGFLDWYRGKGTRVKQPPRPEINEPFGPDSPLIAYRVDDVLVYTDRDSFDYEYGVSTLPDPAQRDIDELMPAVTRVRALAGGIFRGEAVKSAVLLDTSSPGPIALFRRCFAIIEDATTFGHCKCLGGPTLEFYAGPERVATVGLQHGTAIRWGKWKHDARLADGRLLTGWLKDNGIVPTLLEVLYKNPFALTGGRMERVDEDPLSICEQRLFLAEIFRGQGNLDGAVSECDALLAEEPELSQAYKARGFLRSDKGEFEASIADFSAAMERGDLGAEVLVGRAVAFDHLGRHAEAIADCTNAIAADPTYANSYNSRALVRRTIGEIEGAFADFGKAIQLAPGWALPFLNRGSMAHSRGDWGSAIEDYTQAILRIESGSSPDCLSFLAMLFWNRGQAYRSHGDEARAETDLKEAIRRAPKLAEL